MFTISAKGLYGLQAMTELARQYEKGHIQIKDIAATQKIPQHYLEQILVNLKKAKLVESLRGAQGGYRLAKQANTISVMDILSQLEGPLEIVQDREKYKDYNFLWDQLSEQVHAIFSMSLQEVVEIINNNNSALHYFI